MKKALEKQKALGIWHFVEGVRIAGAPRGLRGDVNGLRGDVSGLSGDVSGLRGDVSGLRGDVSGLWGDVNGLWGNVDDCEISEEERASGINVECLIKGEK